VRPFPVAPHREVHAVALRRGDLSRYVGRTGDDHGTDHVVDLYA